VSSAAITRRVFHVLCVVLAFVIFGGGCREIICPPKGSVSLILWVAEGRGGKGLNGRALSSLETIQPDFVDLHAKWDQVETEGGYDFSMTDSALAILRRRGYLVRLLFYMSNLRRMPGEFRSEVSLDQNGCPPPAGCEALSLWGERSRSRFLKFVEAAVRRYRSDRNIIQWSFINGFSENYFPPGVKHRRLYDYSDFSQRKFRWFLKSLKRYDLAEVNERAGTDWRSWDEVRQPLPVWDVVNVSPFWADFQDYRCWSAERQAEDVCRAIRASDGARPIFVFGNFHPFNQGHNPGVFPRFAAIARRYRGGSYVTSGESILLCAVSGTIAAEKGIPLSVECAYPPDREPNFSLYLFNAIESGATYYNLIALHPVRMSPGLRRFMELRAVLRELSRARWGGSDVGFVVSYATGLSFVSWLPYMYHNHNCQPFWARVLNEAVAARRLHYQLRAVPDEGDWDLLEGLSGVLEPGSLVLRREMMDAICAFVRRGGRLVMFGDSGRYVYGSGKKEGHALAEALGYRTTGRWSKVRLEGMAGWLDPIYLSLEERIAPPAAPSLRAKVRENPIISGGEISLAYPYGLPEPEFPARVIAETADGKPVALCWKVGKGEVLMFGGFPDFRDESGFKLMDDCLHWLGAEKVVWCSSAIHAIRRVRGAEQFYVLYNLSDAEREEAVSFPGLQREVRYLFEELPRARRGTIRGDDAARRGLEFRFAPYEIIVVRFTPCEGNGR